MESLNRMIDLLDRKIDEINAKGDISPTELENACKAMKTIYYALCAEAMMDADYEEEPYEEQSYRMGRSYRQGRNRNSYARGRSYRSSYNRGGYSGHTEKEMLMKQIAEMQQELERMQ